MPLPPRRGPAPLVVTCDPVEQLTDPAPAGLTQRLVDAVTAFDGVRTGPSYICVRGTRAFHLAPVLAHGPAEAFLAGSEFGHVHPPYDGSLHLMLPDPWGEAVIAAGWGTAATPCGSLLVYAPRDEAETAVVARLVTRAYLYARGTWTPGPS
ncbi:luciferase family protein [Streptomyces sp. NPDC052693]|uniref:luciferase domain-containing protein n=1 Tax=Streptomyces sp. NPDC052693 TaxID=3155814 RepID=UPI003430A92D